MWNKKVEKMHEIPIPEGTLTKLFVLAPGALVEIPEVMRKAFPGKIPWLVADENTWNAAGRKVFEHLEKAGLNPIAGEIFPGRPMLHPDNKVSDSLAARMPDGIVPVAVGSGVINDLVKRAAGIRGFPYCCVATAASVDGYTSSGAALSVDGRKMTQPCPAPYALLADTDVLRAAPPAMMASGYADLLAKVPAGAEWKIADSLGIEPIPLHVWNMVQKDLREWVADPGNLMNIFLGLAATGFALQLYHDSRPGSGSEHLLSHVLEMEHFSHRGEEVSHGFKVGVGTVASTLLLEFILRHSAEEAMSMAKPLPTRSEREKEIDRLLERGCYGDVKSTGMEKFLEGLPAEARRNLIFRHWDSWKQLLPVHMIPSGELQSMLRKARCPACPEEIGLSREQFGHAVFTAQLIRKRYTVLDMLYESGLLEQAVAEMLDFLS